MSKVPASRFFYTADEPSASNPNLLFDSLHTPLKKLPAQNVHGLVQFRPSKDTNNEPIRAAESNGRQEKYSTLNAVHISPLSDARQQATAAATASFGKEDLFQNSGTQSDPHPFTLKPMSRSGASISADFLPRDLPERSRNPIIVTPGAAAFGPRPALYEDLDDDDDDAPDAPSGEWTSPVVEQALRRQVNKENQFRVFRGSVLRLVYLHLAFRLADYGIKVYQIATFDENQAYRDSSWAKFRANGHVALVTLCASLLYTHSRQIQWVFVILIIVSLARLLRPQDQCRDLPLTNRQRLLIGLAPVDSDLAGEQDPELVIKQRLFEQDVKRPLTVPKYPSSNQFSGYVRHVTPPAVADDAAAALQNVVPRRRLIHSVPVQSWR